MIMRPGIHQALNMRAGAVMQLRYRLRKGERIRIDLQLRLLQKAGYRLDHQKWTDQDMADLLAFFIRSSEQGRQFGPGYIFEKWKSSEGK